MMKGLGMVTNTAKIRALLELIDDLVHDTGKTWSEKKQEVLDQASDSDRNNLLEFSSWFFEE